MNPVRALLLAGGQAPPTAFVRSSYRPGDLVIAADSGLNLARAAGLKADLLVGDLDSLETGPDAGQEVQLHPVHKDASDLELALDEAAQRGAVQALVLGALGGRLDHALFNVVALLERAQELGLQTRLAEPATEVFLAGAGCHEILDRLGWHCSLLPLDARARLTLTGMEYKLESEVLRRASTRGLSNRVRAASATLEVHEGQVLVILTQD